MKKALVVLLLLAVAGGLFAQVSFSGYVDTGLGLVKFQDTDDTYVGLTGVDAGADGIRTQLNASYTNEDGNAGFFARIRAIGTNTGGSFAGNIQFNQAYGWLTGLNGMIKGRAGRMINTETLGVDTLWADTYWADVQGFGVQGYVFPVPGFTLGVGVKSGGGVVTDHPIMDALNYWAGAKYSAGVFAATAEFDYTKDVNTILALSAAFTGLDIVTIDASFHFLHLENTDASPREMVFMEHFGFNLIDNVGLGLGLIEGVKAVDESDLYLAGRLWADYTGLGKIVPRIDVAYAQAGTYDWTGIATRNGWDGGKTYTDDNKFLSISPSVKFQATDSASLELGYVLNKDLGAVPATGGVDKGMNHGAYLDVLVTF